MNMNILLIDDLTKQITSSSSSSSSESFGTESDYSTDDDNRNERHSIQNFVETVVPRYSDTEFKSHFRMTRSTVQKIFDFVTPEIISQHKGGWPKISTEKAVLMTLWYLANLETFRQISDRFNTTLSASHSTITKMVQLFTENRNRFIKWPSKEKMIEISQGFEERNGFKFVAGAIDGSHIPINKPGQDSSDYINRKGYASILLQGVVDHKKRFINIYCGEPGSIHDARLLRKSELFRKVNNNPDLLNKYYLLGDSAYPSLPWLVPPFKDNGHLTANQIQFNYKHSSTRIIIENAFGLLKGRFRRLMKFENDSITFINKCVVTACVMHNICIDCDDLGEEFITEIMDDPDDDIILDPTCLTGDNRREIIFNSLFSN